MIQKHFENDSAKSQGIDTSRKFVVVNGNTHSKKGDILTLIKDDDSRCPFFKNERNGIEYFEAWNSIYYYEKEETQSPLIELLNQYLDLQKKNKDWEIEITISAKRK